MGLQTRFFYTFKTTSMRSYDMSDTVTLTIHKKGALNQTTFMQIKRNDNKILNNT